MTKYCEYILENGRDCSKEALVGWGNPCAWLCPQHFEAALDRARSLINELENMVRATVIDRG